MRIVDIDRSRLLEHFAAFNPSICLHQGKRVMAYRLEDRKTDSWARLAICELDEEWQPIADTNRLLDIQRPHPHTNLFEDPRLYSTPEGLEMSFIAATVHPEKGHVATQGVCRLSEKYEILELEYPDFKGNRNYAFNGNDKIKGEKNWTFVQRGWDGFYVIYTINPLVVAKVHSCGWIEEYSEKLAEINWPYGNLSGSTPLVPYGNNLLGMFHSFAYDAERKRSYHVGWYEIDPRTWKLVSISKSPFFSAQPNDQEDLRPLNATWRPNVVFPCGLMDLGSEYAISYGWQDCRCKIAFVGREEVKNNLVPVKKHYVKKEIINDPYLNLPGGFHCTIDGYNLDARTWPKLQKQAASYGISESRLHEALCATAPEHRKRVAWVPDL